MRPPSPPKTMFRLVRRSEESPYVFIGTIYSDRTQAEAATLEGSPDFVLEEITVTGVTVRVIKYRLGQFGMR
jgi:hypothetical protein